MGYTNLYTVNIMLCQSRNNQLTCVLGSAPDIAGQETVNPVAMILSTAMMLQYSFNLPKEAKAIEDAVRKTIEDGVRTRDIQGTSTTKQVGDHVAHILPEFLSKI